MLALTIDGGELVLRERPTPEPEAGDVVVAVRGAGLNAADLLQRRGLYPAPPGWPVDVPGMEFAGIVSAVGDAVTLPLLGRRVCGLVGGGAQASHCAVPAEHLIDVPDHVPWDQAGGFAEAFVTAHDALVSQGHLRANERALVTGAAGGVGTAAVQIASALGAHVTAVTRTSEHHAALRELGASDTITTDEIGELDPVDVVVELVGAASLNAVQGVLARFARVVVIGVSAGSHVDLDLLNLMSRRATLTGSTMRSRSREEKARAIEAARDALAPLWALGRIRVPVAVTFDIADAAAAYDRFAEPGKLGKVLLTVDQ